MIRRNLCIKAVEVTGIYSLADDTINIRLDGIDYLNVPVRICTDRDCRKKMQQGTFDWAVDAQSFTGGALHFVWPGGLDLMSWPKYAPDWISYSGCPSVTPEAWAIVENGVDQYGDPIIVGFQAVVGVKQHGRSWYDLYCNSVNGITYLTWEAYIAAYPNPDDYPPNYKFYSHPTYWPYVEILHKITEGEDDFIKATIYDLMRDGIAMCPTVDYTSLFLAREHYVTSDYRGLWWGNGIIRATIIEDDQSGDILANNFLKPHINTANLYAFYDSLDEPKRMRPVMVPYRYETDILF